VSTGAQRRRLPDGRLAGISCAFLTPIGNQNNTLILKTGGRFGGYWQLGLPVQNLVVAVAIHVLLVVWRL